MKLDTATLSLALRLVGATSLGTLTLLKMLGLPNGAAGMNRAGPFNMSTGIELLDRADVYLLAALAIWIALGIRTRVVAAFGAVYLGLHFLWIGLPVDPGMFTHQATAMQVLLSSVGLTSLLWLTVIGGGTFSLVRRGWSGLM
ncbi:hypothetical protein [Pseudaestuariivita atlantica]|uniref:DoxX family protein n=1 Tax=Pseudaestuariivita atlantica TaxID=1317121 RepID=A0A0L1JU44_9RHOB|nr:hypothetical protein [Pseudaestuariivita atlantica]KNG95275.1 hypothetical protein ATO11_01165 [Pseudaestuariivita atlantica]